MQGMRAVSLPVKAKFGFYPKLFENFISYSNTFKFQISNNLGQGYGAA